MSMGIKFKSGPPPDKSDSLSADHAGLLDKFRRVRAMSESLTAPLHIEDQVIQSMPDVSPTKWHLAHTTWFFETFLLKKYLPKYSVYNKDYAFLFNSYYHTVGRMHARPRRGLLSRPTVEDVWSYRRHVDDAMECLLKDGGSGPWDDIAFVAEVGLNHEQQHQELILTDIKHVLSCNALFPAAYKPLPPVEAGQISQMTYRAFDGGMMPVGHEGPDFCFDNETPRHDAHIRPFRLGARLVTNGEFLDFIEDGGYRAVELWLSDGWAANLTEERTAPLYWHCQDGAWFEFTLSGLVPLQRSKPVCHVNFYEAQAFASWAGKRLPTEFELEIALQASPTNGNLLTASQEGEALRVPEPCAVKPDRSFEGIAQLYGDAWEWTMSSYAPYPGFKPLEGSLGEYNGKFMCNQYVLRGGSCATPADHIRATYRNFFPAGASWQFSGIRLADDI